MPSKFSLTIWGESSDGTSYFDLHRGDMGENLKEYFAFNAALDAEGSLELYFETDEGGDIPDPIKDKDQYDLLQSFQDNPVLIAAFKEAISQLKLKLAEMEKADDPARFEYWLNFEV